MPPRKSAMELFLAGANPRRTKSKAKQDLKHVTDSTMEAVQKPPKRRKVVDEGVNSLSFVGASAGSLSAYRHDQTPSPQRSMRRSAAYQKAREERHQEKIAMIRELERTARPTARVFDQDSSMRSVELEFNRQKVEADTRSATVFMKNILIMLFTGIEMVNTRFGPWLELDGWGRHCQKDMDKYDAPLSRIYQRIFRHGSINPFVELGMLVGGSLIMYHAQQKMLNSRRAKKDAPPPPSSPATQIPATSADVPKRKMRKFTRPSARGKRVSNDEDTNFTPTLDEESTAAG